MSTAPRHLEALGQAIRAWAIRISGDCARIVVSALGHAIGSRWISSDQHIADHDEEHVGLPLRLKLAQGQQG